MNQAERSKRSRNAILRAALKLFSHRGYRATSVRDIAGLAEVSTGNVYHHFPDKESIFRALLGQYRAAIEDPRFPFNRALAKGRFPDNLEELGRAARESIRKYQRHVALIYVDVVEFEGKHIRKFYSEMARRFASFIDRHPGTRELEARLRPGVTPLSAVMLAGRFYLNFFAVEILFGVPNHFGKATDQVVSEIADILRYGMLRGGGPGPAVRPKRAKR